ncbi:MAG: NADH-quinone oxidoreductase subunit C, partial [Desulfurococcaceae archaeon]
MSSFLSVDDALKPYTVRKEVIKPGRDVYVVEASRIREVMEVLKNSFSGNVYLATIAGVDRVKENVFELNYFVHIVSLGKTIVIRTSTPKTSPRVDTIIDIMPGAFSAEAEIYDLFGVEFVGNRYLRRGFFAPLDVASQGTHPLRKDAQ